MTVNCHHRLDVLQCRRRRRPELFLGTVFAKDIIIMTILIRLSLFIILVAYLQFVAYLCAILVGMGSITQNRHDIGIDLGRDVGPILSPI